MDKKLTLSQTALITLFCVAMILAIFDIPGLSILTIGVAALFAVIGALSDNKSIFMSIAMVILALVFFINPVYISDICLNCILPGIIIGIISKNVLNYDQNSNKFEPIFVGTIAFILGIIANYLVLKYLFNINILDQFISLTKTQLSGQMDLIQESVSTLTSAPKITEESMIQLILNIMPLILFSRAIVLAILTYFLAIFTLKKIRKIDLKEIKFSRFYLPGNAVLTSFVLYILIMLIEIFNIPLYTDLILINLELIFYILFLIQGISVAIYFSKTWLKTGQLLKIIMGVIGITLFGVMGISILGMVDSIFDFRKVKSCEII